MLEEGEEGGAGRDRERKGGRNEVSGAKGVGGGVIREKERDKRRRVEGNGCVKRGVSISEGGRGRREERVRKIFCNKITHIIIFFYIDIDYFSALTCFFSQHQHHFPTKT